MKKFLKSSSKSPDLENEKQMGYLFEKIEFLQRTKQVKVFHFTSSRSQEGVSSIIINLAHYINKKESPQNILLIDGNFSHSILHTTLGLPASPGLSEVLLGKAVYSQSIHKSGLKKFSLLPEGLLGNKVSGSMNQERLTTLFTELRSEFDYLFIDSPPVLFSSDSLSLAIASDAVFLVVQANTTRWESVERAKNYLQTKNCFIAGVIMNRVRQVIPEWIYRRL